MVLTIPFNFRKSASISELPLEALAARAKTESSMTRPLRLRVFKMLMFLKVAPVEERVEEEEEMEEDEEQEDGEEEEEIGGEGRE